MAKIFGKYRNGRRLPYEEILKNCPDVEIFNKCTVVVKNERHNVCRRYRLKRPVLERIFADEALMGKVLDAKSDFYTKRQRKLIFGSLLGAEYGKHSEKEETDMNENIQIPEDDLPDMAEAARLQAEIKELKLEIRRLKSENAALRERAYANRPMFSDGFDFEGQTKAMKELLDECWDERRAEKESGKKPAVPSKPEPKPQPKPEPKPQPKPVDDRPVRRPSGDIPATPPGKSKLYPRLQEFVDRRFISAAEAERISEYAYRAVRKYREARGGFCASYALKYAAARAKIAYNALKENPFLLDECDDATKKFVGRLVFMTRAGKTKGISK